MVFLCSISWDLLENISSQSWQSIFLISLYLKPWFSPACLDHSFKSRTDDIDIRGNFKWKHEILTFISYKENIPENTEHLLCCPILIGKNEIISYIPEYKELFSDIIEQQVYVSRILKENFLRRKTFLPNGPCDLDPLPWSTVLQLWMNKYIYISFFKLLYR